ncbi:DUF6942 family protein [Shewanella fidelis]|uniref:Uncharacterized protein n=1 Tax=Shewanella fidelis TaxID=173509 RepID=A0AAW8NJP5_9GAMM|nr:hypothetical protein [Shewanella fidelis]MDR8523523.1 hypothetical protein [Shewanella fidelis]MDW4810070.1 hypothetical protein [Shewanella fidelis]MDW4814215.1 hypothetical protein [Shewanella fidelis]MDW4822246.1 hypothetical protein [Shewanella fidelis]MDW4826337.1 hypothetical protein [Shewanella fidelis]
MSQNMLVIGNQDASHCFYLPTPPQIPSNWQYDSFDAIASLIAANGNHWRKILTIMAKLSVLDTNWRNYRDTQLLKQNECLVIGATNLMTNAIHHFVCGHQSAHKLELNMLNMTELKGSEEFISSLHSNLYLCPYFDYRQFPNQHIDNLRRYLDLPALL